MNPIKKLAGQTAIYGLSSIVGRFLNYLLVPLYTRFFTTAEYGVISEFYAYSGFLMVLLTFGMETAIFRFVKSDDDKIVQSSALSFLTISSLVFVVLISLFSPMLGEALHYENVFYYFIIFALILGLDAVSAVPFATLRLQEKASRFAVVKLLEIIANIGFNLIFIYAKVQHENGSDTWLAGLYHPSVGVGYIFIANLLASVLKFLLLSDLIFKIGFAINGNLLKRILKYSLPMVIIGFAGIINEMLDRSLMKFLLPGTPTENLAQLGIYSACYKISIVMTLFIQAFRFAAEPFFFSLASKENNRSVYADVMDWFVWFCSLIFLGVTIFKDEFGFFVGESFREGIFIVPILLLANLMLGIYVNLSIWYKLSDNTHIGAVVAIAGAIITVLLLIYLVPLMGYEGAAWATLVCYTLMVVASYLLGKIYYPIKYNIGTLLFYIGCCILFWGLSMLSANHIQLNPYIWKVVLLVMSIIIVSIFKIKPILKLISQYAK